MLLWYQPYLCCPCTLPRDRRPEREKTGWSARTNFSRPSELCRPLRLLCLCQDDSHGTWVNVSGRWTIKEGECVTLLSSSHSITTFSALYFPELVPPMYHITI